MLVTINKVVQDICTHISLRSEELDGLLKEQVSGLAQVSGKLSHGRDRALNELYFARASRFIRCVSLNSSSCIAAQVRTPPPA